MTSSQSELDPDRLYWDEPSSLSEDISNSKTKHTFLSVVQGPSGVEILKQRKTEKDIAPFCEMTTHPTCTGPALHVLIANELTERMYPYSKTTRDALQMYWHLPHSLFSYVELPTQMTYQLRGVETDWKGSTAIAPLSGHGGLTKDISHNAKTLQTFAVINSTGEDFGRDSEAMIKATPAHAYRPEMLCFNFTLSYVQHLEKVEQQMSSEHNAIVRSLKIDEFLCVPEDEEAPDIPNAPLALMAITMKVCVYEVGLGDASKQVDFVEELVEALALPDTERIKEAMLQHVRPRKAWIRCEQSKCQSLLTATQAMVQTVHASLQQRDNEINHRYAANVNVITAITLIFLPGTFVATLFSSSFWDFKPGSTGRVVSGWVWLYFVLTAALTLIVLGIWRGHTVLKQVMRTSKDIWRGESSGRTRIRGDEESGKKSS
ncbi:hypothetical protein IQ07DRAFT_646293 [Pyrenochaeta sp. DS3sAY3a]|nr:hypothetical protein IQ07DRAFT_646293 [Pyrenochaeta sp. DS3sAY3a]